MPNPSVIAHTLNGGLLLAGFALVAMNFGSLLRMETYKLVLLVLALSVAVGVHAISHAHLESAYGYNPWKLVFTA